jgi:hypothetical protein
MGLYFEPPDYPGILSTLVEQILPSCDGRNTEIERGGFGAKICVITDSGFLLDVILRLKRGSINMQKPSMDLFECC